MSPGDKLSKWFMVCKNTYTFKSERVKSLEWQTSSLLTSSFYVVKSGVIHATRELKQSSDLYPDVNIVSYNSILD